ncbi:hypothetical protein NQ318_018969 [Aromia moschata]|uniref:Ionotropic receptor n=1 Tax=Aromia moschata TaxID=1265417 RepID=A0AAV8ZID7_9CUCU|nr:hypothetical protein NQ318_018969 [Aromia moschata]
MARSPILGISFPKVLYNYELEKPIGSFDKNSSYIFLITDLDSLKQALQKATAKDKQMWEKINLVEVGQENPYLGKIPKKVHGCQVNVTWGELPLVMNNAFNKRNPGVMFIYLNTLGEVMNLRIKYLERNNFTNSCIHEDYKGLVDHVIRDNIDLALHLGTLKSDMRPLDRSLALYESSPYIALPSRRKQINTDFIVNMFSPAVLIVTAGTLILSAVFWKLLSGDSLAVSAFTVFQLVVQMSTHRILARTPIKIMFVSFLIFIICLNTAYQARMSCVLTTPRLSAKIKTLEQYIFETDIKYQVATNSHDITFNATLQNALKKKLSVVIKGWDAYFKEFLEKDSYAMPISGLHLNVFKNPEKIDTIKINARKVMYSIATKPGYPLLETIDYWIEEMRTKGLPQKFIFDSTIDIEKFSRNSSYLAQTPLKLAHLRGAFSIIIIGHLLATILHNKFNSHINT